MKKGLISIIIPTFNRKDLLGQCLESVFSQDYKNIEVILVDDNSNDSTVQFIAKKYPSVKIIMNRENYGPSFARNQGVFHSNGEYVLFLDSDTQLINKEMFSRMVEIMFEDETIGSLGGEAIVDEQKKITGLVQFRKEGSRPIYHVEDPSSLIQCDYLPTSNCLVKRSLLNMLGGFDPYYFYQAEDLDLGFRLKKKGYQILSSPQVVALHKYSAIATSDMTYAVFRGKMRFYLKNQGIIFLIVYPLVELKLFVLNRLKRRDKIRMSRNSFEETERIPQNNKMLMMLNGFLRACAWNLLHLLKTISARNINFLNPDAARRYKSYVENKKGSSRLLSRSFAENIKRKSKSIIPHAPSKLSYAIISILNKARVSRVGRFQTPKNIYLFITYACNARCHHCFYWRKLNTRDRILDVEKVERIVSSLKNDCSFVLTGGEPFLREDIHQVCRILSASFKCNSVSIPTNGLLPSLIHARCRSILTDCPEIRSLNVLVSIDGLKKTHEEIRGVPGGFEKALETLVLLINLEKEYTNFSVRVTTTISKFNYKEIMELINYIQPFQVIHDFNLARAPSSCIFGLSPSLINIDFEPKEELDKDLTVQDLRDLFSRIKKLNALSIYPFWDDDLQLYMKYALELMDKKEKIFECYAGKLSCIIYPNGDVSLCEMTKPFGNLRETDFDFGKLWNSESADKMRQKIKNCSCTHICNLITNMSLDSRTLFEKFVVLPKENVSAIGCC